MNFDDPIVQQYLTGGGMILFGLSGWLLPYRWNLLRLRRSLAGLFSEKTNQMIPRIVGSALLAIGLLIVILTMTIGRLDK